eukprot:1114168-Amorphochlora_amoeboformis.AAC.2
MMTSLRTALHSARLSRLAHASGSYQARRGITTCQPSKTRIGWIGAGVMGRAMASHVIKAGYDTTVFSRTEEKCKPLQVWKILSV